MEATRTAEQRNLDHAEAQKAFSEAKDTYRERTDDSGNWFTSDEVAEAERAVDTTLAASIDTFYAYTNPHAVQKTVPVTWPWVDGKWALDGFPAPV